ncbi:MAG: hypothetical protein HXX09_16560 [Bacteroidetes bacterium]|nr:hypothetical protein [Bacteroidota bacterium]
MNLQYIPKDNNKIIGFTFKFNPNDTITQVVYLFPQKVKKNSKNPMFLQTEFKGQRIYAEKLLSMDLKLYAKNDKTGLYDNEIIIKNTYAHYDYPYYSYNRYGYGEKNYKGDLNKLMYPSEFNTEDRINSLFVDNELLLDEYPKQIKAIILVKWIGGAQEFSTFLTLDESEAGSKVKTNPFG